MERKRDGKLPGQVDQQGAIDTRDLCRCQSESQTGSQLWFVPITLLTLFNLGFGQSRAQTTSVHSQRKLGNPCLCESALNLTIEMHYVSKGTWTPVAHDSGKGFKVRCRGVLMMARIIACIQICGSISGKFFPCSNITVPSCRKPG